MITEARVNIKDLILEEMQSDSYVFRPGDEFSQAEFDSAIYYVEKLEESKNDWQYFQLLYQLRELFPNKEIPAGDIEIATRFINKHNWITKDKFTVERFGFKLFPGRFDRNVYMDVQLAQFLEMMQSEIDGPVHITSPEYEKIENLASFRIIYPDAYKDFKNPESARARIVSSMSSFDQGLVIARNLRILFPQYPIDDVISDATITQARRSFDWYKSSEQWDKAINDAFSLFILTAKDIRTGSGELEVMLPKKVVKEDWQLPEARRF